MSRPSAADDPPSIAARLTSLERVMGVVDSRVDDNDLRSARDVTRQITERLSLSPAHTVVALAGATGSGKSSIYNALAGLDLSEVGVRRPVTNAPHACVWGRDGAGPLLDWLSIPYDNRTGRESALDADSQAELRGLVLLDLPDHDSTQLAHRLEVDRLVELVDLLVWVLDPQKYADEAIHARYLRRLSRHAGVTVVVLNQVDMLSGADTEACLADVRRLLDADGLRGVPLVPLSALRGDGMPELKDRITATVSSRQAAVRRLTADLDTVADELAPLAGPEVREGVDRSSAKRLYTTLAESAGATAVGEAVERGYKFTASRSLGWPLIHWFGRAKADPLAPLRENTGTRRRTTARPAVLHPVQLPAVEESLRFLADDVAQGLPAPWPRLVHRAARSEIDQLPDALDRAVATADLGLARRPLWWWGYRVLQYLLVLALLGGLAWTLGLAIAAAVGGDDSALEVGDLVLPLTLLFGGLVLGPVLHVVGMIVARRGARAARLRAEQSVLDAVTTVARERVLAPVRAELSAYAQVRDALIDFGIPPLPHPPSTDLSPHLPEPRHGPSTATDGPEPSAPEPERGPSAAATQREPSATPAQRGTSAHEAAPEPSEAAAQRGSFDFEASHHSSALEGVQRGASAGGALFGGSAGSTRRGTDAFGGPAEEGTPAASEAEREGAGALSGLGPLPSASNYPDPFQQSSPPSPTAPADQGGTDSASERPGLVGPRPVRPSTMFSEAASTSAPTPSGTVEPETGQTMTHSTPPGTPDHPVDPPTNHDRPGPPRPWRRDPSHPDASHPGAGQPSAGQPGRQGGAGQGGDWWPEGGGRAGSVPPPPRPDAVRRGAIPPAPATPPVAPGVRPYLGANTPPPTGFGPPQLPPAPDAPPQAPGLPRPGTPISTRSTQPGRTPGHPGYQPGNAPPADPSAHHPGAGSASPSAPYADANSTHPGASPTHPGASPTHPGAGSTHFSAGSANAGAGFARDGEGAATRRPGATTDDGAPARSRRGAPKLPPAPPPRPEVEADPEVVWARTRPAPRPTSPAGDAAPDASTRRRESANAPEEAPDDLGGQPQRKGLRGLFNRRKESADVVDRWWATTDDGDDPFGRPPASDDDSRPRVPGQR
ncbi:hypothetical protein [Cryptosporangium sp. NPDC048952]|uniref:YfjP family GTPase n=1 Tax=Cryptosporangium sp. NPDC048952 TaxID=3363961 RepID=UPI003720DD14